MGPDKDSPENGAKRRARAVSAKEIFGERAGRYEELDVFSQEKYYQPLIDFAGPRPDDRVLDLATGTGLLALLLARRAKEVTGSDVTPEMLERAVDRAKKGGQENIRFVEAEASSLPFPDASFDLVVCRTAFHHFPEPKKALTEIYRVLGPGGRLVLADVVGAYGPGQDRAAREYLEKLIDPSHVLAYTEGEFTAMLEEAGFNVEQSQVPESKALPVEIILGLEKIEDFELKTEITSFLNVHANTDLGGLEITESGGRFVLKWPLIFIAAAKEYKILKGALGTSHSM